MESPPRTVSVLIPFPVEKAYTYAVPDGLDVTPGDYVTVPLGSREISGVVWDDPPENVPAKKLKEIIARYDLPPMPDVQRKLIDWTARYSMNARGAVLKMTLSVPGALDPSVPVVAYRIAEWVAGVLTPSQTVLSPSPQPSPSGGEGVDAVKPSPLRGEGGAHSAEGEGGLTPEAEKLLRNLTPQRRRILEILSDGQARRASEIAEEAGCTPGVVKGMVGSNLLEPTELYAAAPCRKPMPRGKIQLSDAQQAAADNLKQYINSGEYHAALLDGVTGAGKTEVYFEAVAQALKNGRQALILLPEIALSNAFLDRFRVRFGCAPGLWHSQLSAGQRKRTWRGVADGTCRVIVGARSALFLPYADLGVIIVDEEHDPAYKQEEGTIYNARDMAIVRANMGRIPVVLVSATPSLETMHNVWNERYHQLHLPDRFGGARFPDVHIVDMREDKPESQHFIAPTVKAAITETLEAGQQALLFLNRRGYAPLTICRSCGHRMECPRCTAWLVEHRKAGRLQCHHCGFEIRDPNKCPSCHEEGSFAACGPGVERIYEEAKKYWPEARLLLMASDTAGSDEKLREMLTAIKDREVDIIVGTQIIAKGHHFPGLTCVGVIDADLGLSGGDLRATERTYQLLHQVAGRAGRAQEKGRVYLQTFNPESRIVQALGAGERDQFLRVEMAEREAANMPPVSRLAGIIVAGRDEGQVDEVSRALGRSAPRAEGLVVLGPAPAQFAMLRGKHRRRLLVVADKKLNVQKTLAHWIGGVKIPSTVRVTVDIDPQSFF